MIPHPTENVNRIAGIGRTPTEEQACDWLAAISAIDAAYVADRRALKSRYPGRPATWPAEALKEADAIQARFDEAIDHLFESCERGEEVAL
jgi:hypothetical protein